MNSATESDPPFDPSAITRPHSRLMQYYLLTSLLAGPFFPLLLIPLMFKYQTLKYRFDDEGIAMSWGLLFRREIHLTYRRIQDIHLTRNLFQRWMGLATVDVQTASGSAGPEMTIEGILQAERLRDHLYGKMRGARREGQSAPSGTELGVTSDDETIALLREIRDALKRLSANREQPS